MLLRLYTQRTRSLLRCARSASAVHSSTVVLWVQMLAESSAKDPVMVRSFREEVGIMCRLKHPNCVRCFGGRLQPPSVFLVEELMECTLDTYLHRIQSPYTKLHVGGAGGAGTKLHMRGW
jgi:hypothetical protein